MAYKESNPLVIHLVLFMIIISVLGFFQLLFVTMSINIFVLTLNDTLIAPISLMLSGYAFMLIAPKAYIFLLVAFGVSMYKRSAYGEKHASATVAALLVAVLGTIAPVFFFIIAMVFEKGYLTLPFLLNSIFISLIVALFLFVKDVGGRDRAIKGLIIYLIGAAWLVLIETISLFLISEDEMREGLSQVLAGASIPWTLVCLAGIIYMLLAYVKALGWAKEHKPKIDEQQAQQMKLQQEQVVMQQEQLELQKQQIQMLEKTIKMLTEMRSDLIGPGSEQIEERASSVKRKEKKARSLEDDFNEEMPQRAR